MYLHTYTCIDGEGRPRREGLDDGIEPVQQVKYAHRLQKMEAQRNALVPPYVVSVFLFKSSVFSAACRGQS
jgi:hypothetical protein